MSKTREQKQQIVAGLVEKIGRIKSGVFTSIAGYTMTDADTLRKKGHEQGMELTVAKKSLLTRAFESKGITLSPDILSGSVLTTFGFEDEIGPAKLMATFAKDREGIKILGGVLEGGVVDASAVKRLSTLPGKQELLAKLVGTLNAPISGFVNVLAGNLRGLVTVLSAIKDK